MPEDFEERRADPLNQKRWHLDKTVNVGHILTTFLIAGSLFAYANHMDRRVTMLEERMSSQQQTNMLTQDAVKELAREVKDEIRGLRTDIIQVMRDRIAKP
jgi:hypothetical protein